MALTRWAGVMAEIRELTMTRMGVLVVVGLQHQKSGALAYLGKASGEVMGGVEI